MHTPNRFWLAVTALAALALLMLAFAASPPRQPVIATVDLNRALEGLNERATLEDRLRQREAELQGKLEDMVAELEDERSKLEVMPAGSERRRLEDQLRQMVIRIEFESQFSRRLLDQTEAELLKGLYEKMVDATGRLAERNGYTMVIATDERMRLPAPEGGATSADVQRAILSRRMLHVDRSHDITEELVNMMNNEFAAARN